MRIAIIGSGPSGLVSAKHCLISLPQLSCLHIYEKLDRLGGVWCGDKNQSVLYDNLKTNLPKEVMEFEDLFYGNDKQSSFMIPSCVTRYLVKFAELYQLKKYIKFETSVIKVRRIDGEWEIISCYLPKNHMITEKYDAVFVCNGHYSVPEIPFFSGLERFKRYTRNNNTVIHSIYYRSPNVYRGMKVLIIGAGPSAQDISIDIASAAEEVYLSHHFKELYSVSLPSNIIHKPDVKYFSDNGVTFIDGTSCDIDGVVLATGYRYNLDFLDDSCGIRVEDYGYVTPLYKQLFSITHPTMAFIGLPFRTVIFPLLETQAKCVIQIWSGKAQLPTVAYMHNERQLMEENYRLKGIPKRKYHNISHMVREYLTEISQLGNIQPLKEVIFGIYEKASEFRKVDLQTYRNYRFDIIDSEHFEVTYVEEYSPRQALNAAGEQMEQ